MTDTSRPPLPNFAPKRKVRSPFLDSRAYAFAQAMFVILNALPAAWARAFGLLLGRIAWKLDKRHRQRVIRQMTIAFRDELPLPEKERLCRKFFEHIGLSVVEFARLSQLTAQNVDQLVDFSELKTFDALLARGKGLLCVPAHHGNWELCGYSVSLKGYPLKSVARPLDNPLLNEMVMAHRERSGNEIIQKWKVLWKLKKLLDRQQIVTMSVDQNGGVGGLFVPCFTSLASTVTSPAELHVATGTPIIVATLNRKEDGVHHVLRVWDIIEHPPTDDHARDIYEIVTRINAAVEKAVRAYPEQWLWFHQRWKTRPPGELPGADGLPPRIVDKVHQPRLENTHA
jgi:KDO2-lipid IV(A) lauroyltransferase